MTSAKAKAWNERWERVNAAEEEELRASTPEEGLDQLESLYASIDFFGWRDALGEGEEELRAKWIKAKARHAKRS
jgi:hypothetical protein